MYTLQQKKIVVKMGEWLGSMPWDTFSTITYRYDVKEKQNYNIMKGLSVHVIVLILIQAHLICSGY